MYAGHDKSRLLAVRLLVQSVQCGVNLLLLLCCSGLHESLHMTVAIPLLWGIPPRHETLRYVRTSNPALLSFAAAPQTVIVCLSAALLLYLVEVMLKRCTGSGSCMGEKACDQTAPGRTIKLCTAEGQLPTQHDCILVYIIVSCCAIDSMPVLNV